VCRVVVRDGIYVVKDGSYLVVLKRIRNKKLLLRGYLPSSGVSGHNLLTYEPPLAVQVLV
jgi:hypothetical protein